MVAPSRFCHVVYKTKRYEEMLDWYVRVFEAQVQHQDDRIAFLTYDDEHHRFAIAKIGDEPQDSTANLPDAVGVAHLAYAWDELEGLLHTYKRLKREGILPRRCMRHGVTLSIYYDDPDGNNMEFQIDLLDADAPNAFMRSQMFADNPVGDMFDPDQLVQAFEAGQPVDRLIFRDGQPEGEGTRFVRRKSPVTA